MIKQLPADQRQKLFGALRGVSEMCQYPDGTRIAIHIADAYVNGVWVGYRASAEIKDIYATSRILSKRGAALEEAVSRMISLLQQSVYHINNKGIAVGNMQSARDHILERHFIERAEAGETTEEVEDGD